MKKEHFLTWIFFGAVRLRAGWRLLIFILLMIAFFLMISIPASLVFIGEVSMDESPVESFEGLFFIFLLLMAVLLASFIMTRYFDKRSFSSLGFAFDRGWWMEIVIGLMLGFFMIGFLFAIGLLIGSYETTWTFSDYEIFFLSFLQYSLILLVYATFEEAVFRGYAFQTLMEGTGKIFSVILSSAIFGLLHYFNPHGNMMGVVNTALAGAFLAVLYIKKRSLWLPIFLHFSWNFSMGYLFGLPVSGIDFKKTPFTTRYVGSGWLSGGEFGLEGSILASLLLLTMIFLVILTGFIKPSTEMKKRWENYSAKKETRDCTSL